MADLRTHHRRALETCAEIVDQVKTSQLNLPTPCSLWTVGELLAHMIVQNHGFAVAASGELTELSFWHPAPPGDDPVPEFRESAEAVLTAFADDAVLSRQFWLPELAAKAFAGEQAIGFHFVDCVVHGWDVARSIGAKVSFDDDVLEAVRPISLAVRGGEHRDREGSMFAREVAVTQQSTLDVVIAWLGRDPAWQPA